MDVNKYKDDSQSEARVPTQARLDIRQLAAFADYLEVSGIRPQTRSHLVHSIVGLFHDLLVANGFITPVPSAAEAYEKLEAKGIKWSEGTPGHAALVKSLQEEDRLLESLTTITNTPAGMKQMEDEIEKLLAKRTEKEDN